MFQDKRAEHDSKQFEQSQLWGEFQDLLTSLRSKMEEAVNALRYV